MARLRWLQVNKFRSVKPGTRLTFNDGYNVLLGQNGTGKTTLLNLVAAAIQSDFASLKDVDLDISFELASNDSTAAISVRNEQRPLPLPAALEGISLETIRYGASSPDGGWRPLALSATVSLYDKQTGLLLELTIDGHRGIARRTDEQGSAHAFELDFSNFERLPLRVAIIVALTQWAANASVPVEQYRGVRELFLDHTSGRRFDESLEYFNSLGQSYIELLRYPDGHISYTGNLEPIEAIHERLSHRAREEWGANRYELTDDELEYLKHTIRLLDFESAEAVLELQNSAEGDNVEVMRLGNLRFYFSHRGGWKISEKLLSYGQKRMLAFMHYLATSKSVVVADELVNGLHHGWIRACLETLGERQVFLTSQNPLLLDYLNFQSPEEVQSKFVLCRWEKGTEQMVWENMSQEAAADFFDSYKVGFQQVGELLRSKGLW